MFLQTGTLKKEQVKKFIMKALKQGIFTQFFTKQDKEIEMSVDALFNDFFMELFTAAEVPGSIDKTSIKKQINAKFADDESLKDVLLLEFEKLHPEQTDSQMVTDAEVKFVLTTIMKSHMKSMLAQREE